MVEAVVAAMILICFLGWLRIRKWHAERALKLRLPTDEQIKRDLRMQIITRPSLYLWPAACAILCAILIPWGIPIGWYCLIPWSVCLVFAIRDFLRVENCAFYRVTGAVIDVDVFKSPDGDGGYDRNAGVVIKTEYGNCIRLASQMFYNLLHMGDTVLVICWDASDKMVLCYADIDRN